MTPQDPVAPAASQGAQTFATPIIKVTEQVGQHVLTALDQPDTVAVLSTIVPGVQADRVVSIPLSSAELSQVQVLLQELVPPEPLEEADMPCVGFHCDMKRPEQSD